MLKLLRKQKTFHKSFNKYEFKKKVFQTIIKLTTNPLAKQYAAALLTRKLKMYKGYKSRNICFLTGRSRSVYRKMRLSRMHVRELANAGFFVGFRKTSW